jgi:hypothetical protein
MRILDPAFYLNLKTSVVIPDSGSGFRAFLVNPDPDPDPNPDSGFWWQRFRIKYSWILNIFFWSKIAMYESLGMSKLQGKPWDSKGNIQHFRRWNLLTVFLFFWVIFALWIRIRIHNTAKTQKFQMKSFYKLFVKYKHSDFRVHGACSSSKTRR